MYHTSEHEAPDPDADSSIEPEADELEAYIGNTSNTSVLFKKIV